jgi:hypothetical protein
MNTDLVHVITQRIQIRVIRICSNYEYVIIRVTHYYQSKQLVMILKARIECNSSYETMIEILVFNYYYCFNLACGLHYSSVMVSFYMVYTFNMLLLNLVTSKQSNLWDQY